MISGNSVMITYDSGAAIDLNSTFQIVSPAQLEAYIDGCGGSQ